MYSALGVHSRPNANKNYWKYPAGINFAHVSNNFVLVAEPGDLRDYSSPSVSSPGRATTLGVRFASPVRGTWFCNVRCCGLCSHFRVFADTKPGPGAHDVGNSDLPTKPAFTILPRPYSPLGEYLRFPMLDFSSHLSCCPDVCPSPGPGAYDPLHKAKAGADFSKHKKDPKPPRTYSQFLMLVPGDKTNFEIVLVVYPRW